jgi:uncharacterized protein (TIGR02145 family)
MKKLLLCAAFIAASFTSSAQVGIGTTTPDASAALEIESTTQGFLPPRMSTAARNLINTPVAGLVIYNTTANCLQWFNGALWFDTCTQTTEGPPNSNLTVASPSYQGESVIGTTGIGYNGEAVPSGSTITVNLTNNDSTNAQGYGLSATDAGTGLIYAATGTIAAGVTIPVVLTHNAVVMPALESGVLNMPLLGTSSTLVLLPRIDVKSIPASATTLTDVVYGEQTWMDRNLGARRAATALNDVFSYGNFYQWGRPADGHEITVLNGATKDIGRGLFDATATLAADAYPSYANFIVTARSTDDWLANPSPSGLSTRWATASQGPCPTNYHVPTSEEWVTADTAVFGSGNGLNGSDTSGWDNNTETYESALRLPSPGIRMKDIDFQDYPGDVQLSGEYGTYWSSDNSNGDYDGINDVIIMEDDEGGPSFRIPKARGCNVRCIKN